jgi:hypothetical protein
MKKILMKHPCRRPQKNPEQPVWAQSSEKMTRRRKVKRMMMMKARKKAMKLLSRLAENAH